MRHLLATLLLLIVLVPNLLAADDAIRARLDSAKDAYSAEIMRFQTSVEEWLTRREDAARKDGNKKLVDQIKVERSAFIERGDLPSNLPATIRQKSSTAIRTLEGVYEAAIKSYVRDKQDDLAAAVEGELKDFQSGKVGAVASNDTRLFNGQNLIGWRGIRDLWSVKDGTIVGATPANGIKFNSCLCTAKSYGDFELKCKVKLIGASTANSGIQLRSEIINLETFECRGPQCDIGQAYWGSLYNEGGGGMYREADKGLVAKVLKPDAFNELFIRCVGSRVVIHLNGHPTVDVDIPTLPKNGVIGWQLHSGVGCGVVIKDIEFKEI